MSKVVNDGSRHRQNRRVGDLSGLVLFLTGLVFGLIAVAYYSQRGEIVCESRLHDGRRDKGRERTPSGHPVVHCLQPGHPPQEH